VTARISRDVLPIPDSPFEGTLPYDAKDPGTAFPTRARPSTEREEQEQGILTDEEFLGQRARILGSGRHHGLNRWPVTATKMWRLRRAPRSTTLCPWPFPPEPDLPLRPVLP
jgi:hypothetical protein